MKKPTKNLNITLEDKHFNLNTMNEETETAVEFLFRRYMDNKQKLTLADFINAYDIETELLIQASEQNYQSEN